MQEQRLGQKFVVNVTLLCGRNGLREAGQSDDLTQTVDYAQCYKCASARFWRCCTHGCILKPAATQDMRMHTSVKCLLVSRACFVPHPAWWRRRHGIHRNARASSSPFCVFLANALASEHV